MPIENNMMFIRPKNCDYCLHGYNALAHMVSYAQNIGFNVNDVEGINAIKTVVENEIDTTDPMSIYGFGHGLEGLFTGDTQQIIFSVDDCSSLNGRIVYLLSCLTANLLGPAIIQNGAVAYAGFNIEWTWIANIDKNEEFIYPDPYNDPYAHGFYESANELWKSLTDGDDFIVAIQKSINKYNEWIDYWFYTNPEDPESQDCIKWLAVDRDGLVALTDCMLHQTQQECESYGCKWENDECIPMPQTDNSGLALLAIPVLLVIGLAFISYTISEKK